MVVVVVSGLLVLFVAAVWLVQWIDSKPYREHKRKLFRRGRIKKVDQWGKL